MTKKRITLIVVWTLVAFSWMGLVGVYFTDPTLKAWTIAVTAAAVVTEIAVWTTAAILGLSIWESRKKIIWYLTRPLYSK